MSPLQRRCLERLAEHRHFAMAARRLHLSQTTFYGELLAIEAAIGVNLICRTGGAPRVDFGVVDALCIR